MKGTHCRYPRYVNIFGLEDSELLGYDATLLGPCFPTYAHTSHKTESSITPL